MPWNMDGDMGSVTAMLGFASNNLSVQHRPPTVLQVTAAAMAGWHRDEKGGSVRTINSDATAAASQEKVNG